MPIRPLLEAQREAFRPEEIASITDAFERSLRRLGLIDRKDAAVRLVAEATLEIAKGGERDPLRLSEMVLARMARARPACS